MNTSKVTEPDAGTFGSTDFRIILVVGNSRSGTTLMGHILGNHDLIFTFNELHFFEEMWDPQTVPRQLSPDEATQMVAQLLSIQRNNYFYRGSVQDHVPEARDFVNKISGPMTPPKIFEAFLLYETKKHMKCIACLQTPRNVYYLEEILGLYPNACAINMVRDPRDVLLSQKRRWRNRFSGPRKIPLKHIIRTWADYHPITIGILWRSGVRAGERFAHHPRVFRVQFESLVQSPNSTLQDICDFIGIEFQQKMLEVPLVNSSNMPDRLEQKGIESSVVGRWKEGGINWAEIYIIQKMTEREMTLYGYNAIGYKGISAAAMLYYGLTWIFKMGLAFIMNVNRVRNLIPAIKRRLI